MRTQPSSVRAFSPSVESTRSLMALAPSANLSMTAALLPRGHGTLILNV